MPNYLFTNYKTFDIIWLSYNIFGLNICSNLPSNRFFRVFETSPIKSLLRRSITDYIYSRVNFKLNGGSYF